MKRSFFLTALLIAAMLSYAQAKTGTIHISTSIYCDHCKACATCGSHLEQAVYALKGVKRVDIDEKSKTIQVIYNPQKTDPGKIKQAIAGAGYDADDLKADPAAYGRLDDCCKKQ